jgi:hypothetical protein
MRKPLADPPVWEVHTDADAEPVRAEDLDNALAELLLDLLAPAAAVPAPPPAEYVELENRAPPAARPSGGR